MNKNIFSLTVSFISACCIVFSQSDLSAAVTPKEYKDITYHSVDGFDLKLDVFQHPSSSTSPVIIYYHGGGWTSNTRASSWGGFKFYLSLGFSVVNVDYRLAGAAKAPAAVQDCRAALAWVGTHAAEYRFDVKKIVVYGTSAGGHLALMTGMVPAGASFDLTQCKTMPRPAAVINFYGITDVADLLDGANKRGWANTWIGAEASRMDRAKIMSPIGYVGKSNPPVITVHGDADPTVPYSHALRLEESMKKSGSVNKLVTVKNGGHGRFSKEENKEVEREIELFLREYSVIK